MQLVISPAKSLNFAGPVPALPYTQPGFLDRSQTLIGLLRKLSPLDVSSLMGISDALSVLNVTRFAEWSLPFTPVNARAAILAFNGDVYEGLDAASLSKADLKWAQEHVRILSGLYGLLKPLDLIQAYRLEMGTRLANPVGKDLYAFWGDIITEALAAGLATQKHPVLVNLASEEYFKAVRPKLLGARVVSPVFQDWKSGQYKIISFYAKRARGLMSRYIVTHRISNVAKLKDFDVEGYAYVAEASSENEWVFRRRVE